MLYSFLANIPLISTFSAVLLLAVIIYDVLVKHTYCYVSTIPGYIDIILSSVVEQSILPNELFCLFLFIGLYMVVHFMIYNENFAKMYLSIIKHL